MRKEILTIVEFDENLYFSRDNWTLKYETDVEDYDSMFGPRSRILKTVSCELELDGIAIPLMSIYDDNGIYGRMFGPLDGSVAPIIRVARSKLDQPIGPGWTKFAEGCIV